MNKNLRRLLPVLLTSFLLLSSCKLHVGSLASNAIHWVARPFNTEPLDYLPVGRQTWTDIGSANCEDHLKRSVYSRR